MKISDNFDRWMFDYKEGNLSASDAEAFENFLIQHPEYEVDADAWDMAFIDAEPVAYPHVESLQKNRRVAGWYYWSAAATLLLLLGSVAFLTQTTSNNEWMTSMEQKGLSHSSYTSFLNNNQNTPSAKATLLLEQLTSSQDFGSGQTSESVNPERTETVSPIALNSLNMPQGNLLVNNQDETYRNSDSDQELLVQETNKIKGSDHAAKYSGNPETKNLEFDVNQRYMNRSGSAKSILKKYYRKLEKMLGYPPGLTNMRDPQLIIPQNNLLAFNSAFTGGMLRSRFEMNYRNQWLGTNQASQELNISYDNYSYGMRGGVGVLVNAQDYGMGQFGDYNVSLLYSPKLVVANQVVIEPSVKLTMGSIVANGPELTPNSAFEMDRGRILQTGSANQLNHVSRQWYKDYGLGLMVNTKWFFAGFSADNLNGHYENVYGNDLSSPAKTPVRFSGVIGTDYESNKKTMTLSPFIVYQQYGNQPEFWGGANYRQNWLIIGGAVSSKKEFSASIGMKFETFKLVYQYDYTESLLSENRMGSHNLGIRFNAKRKTQRLTH